MECEGLSESSSNRINYTVMINANSNNYQVPLRMFANLEGKTFRGSLTEERRTRGRVVRYQERRTHMGF
jgi:hypothetical protein